MSRNLILAVLGMAMLGAADPSPAQETRPGDRWSSAAVDSSEYRTRKGFVACRQMEGLARIVAHVAREETSAYRAMLADSTSGCFPLRAGISVAPVGYNDYVVELRPAGMKGTIFTVAEAIEKVEAPE